MASSNRHWPSLFKSKPTCTTRHHHQWPSNDCHRSPYAAGCEERSPEPKPRWNPKPEQIRILESIFNSGMVNPPREEIRKIRAQLQEYGQVGDANVFYWFQNRKSRSKHKSRHLQKPQNHHSPATTTTTKMITTTTTTSSSSSSDRSHSKSFDFHLNSPTASVNQHFNNGGGGGGYHHHIEFSHEQQPFYFPTVQQPPPPPPPLSTSTTGGLTEGFCFSELGNLDDQTVGSCTGMLLTDLMMMNQQSVMQKMNHNDDNNNNINSCKGVDEKSVKVCSYSVAASSPLASIVAANPTTTTVSSTTSDIQGVVEPMTAKSTVFINDVAFEVAVGPFNVREAFGDDAVLIHSYGQPVVTNEWGITLQSLQHGAFYYLVRSF